MRNLKSLILFIIVITAIGCSGQSPAKTHHKSLSKIYKESNIPGFAITIN